MDRTTLRAHGKYAKFDNVVFEPKPASKPHLPIWVGGESPPALRRTVKFGDGWYPVSNNQHSAEHAATAEGWHRRLHRVAEKAGRDPGTIDVGYLWFGPPVWTAQTVPMATTVVQRQCIGHAGGRRGVGKGRRRARDPVSATPDDRGRRWTLSSTSGKKWYARHDTTMTHDRQNFGWIEHTPLATLTAQAAAKRDAAHGRLVSVLAESVHSADQAVPRRVSLLHIRRTAARRTPAYLSPDAVLTIARAGAAAGCTEALFTLGDKPELRYRAAREALAELGHDTTIEYLREMCALVLKETGLLPHINPGVMSREEIASLREVSASAGIMLESSSERLCEPGGVHYGSPDKSPAVRLDMMRLAGELAVPFTTGILIGIGETRAERLESLVAIRDLHAQYGHIQEVIVQNFRAKPEHEAGHRGRAGSGRSAVEHRRGTPDPAGRRACPGTAQSFAWRLRELIGAGIDDWGGVSPVTPDHVNPEAPWPQIEALAQRTAEMGKVLVPRLPVYPTYAFDADRWCAPDIAHTCSPRDRRGGLGARGRLGARSDRRCHVGAHRCCKTSIPRSARRLPRPCPARG